MRKNLLKRKLLPKAEEPQAPFLVLMSCYLTLLLAVHLLALAFGLLHAAIIMNSAKVRSVRAMSQLEAVKRKIRYQSPMNVSFL